MKRAKLLVIEGTDGSGKQTQSELIYEYYKEKGYKVKLYSFPIYDSATGKIVGGPYLGKSEICESYFNETSASVDPLVSSLYYAADRRYNFLSDIEKSLYDNDLVILDRYTTSNLGHQVGKAKNDKEREKIINFIEKLEFDLCELPKPDKVIFLYMPLEATIYLRQNRNSGDGNENSIKHLKNAEKCYLMLQKRYNWDYINCINTKKYKEPNNIKTIDSITQEIIKKVDTLLKTKVSKINKMTRF